MNKFDKLYQKYATVSPLLPPAPEEEAIPAIPGLGKLPEIKDISPEEMERWDDYIAEKNLQKDLDITKELVDIGKEEKLEQELGTIPAIPPKKKANWSPNTLLKMCSKFYDLCRKF
jgi:hypothetical protein